MYKAFLEAPARAKAAAICFILGKIMFVSTAFCMLFSNVATVISLCLYALLILSSVVLCLIEGFSGKKKTYKELEEELRQLRATIKEQNEETNHICRDGDTHLTLVHSIR